MDCDNKVVLEADIPLHMRRGSSQVQVILTQSQSDHYEETESNNSNSSSTNTLQVPDFISTESLDIRRRSLNSLLQENQNRIQSLKHISEKLISINLHLSVKF